MSNGPINDSGLSLEMVMATLDKAGIEISYGAMKMKTERRALEDATREVSNYDAEKRVRVMTSVDRALRKALPILEAGGYSRKLCDNFHANLVLWEALKRMAS